MSRFLKLNLLCAGVFFVWGCVTVKYAVFPWQLIAPIEKEINDFIEGDTSEKTGLTEKITNDLSFRPSRQLFDYQISKFRAYQQVRIPSTKTRRLSPNISTPLGDGEPLPGYRFIFGSFDFKNHLHGGILLDQSNKVINTWVVDEENIKLAIESEVQQSTQGKNPPPQYKPPERRLPQGVIINQDGSIIFNDGDRGNGIHRMDWCGDYVWNTNGHFHHSITFNQDDQSIWTFGPNDMMQLDPVTGKILRTISLNDLYLNNPDISIFSVRRDMRNGTWHYDPIHKNDIEALGSKFAVGFEKFEPGDLLVSHRSTNTVFVFDPDSLKIKWWRAGQTRRQHDPDWQSDGTITVFDNNLKEDYTEQWDGYLPDGETPRYSRIISFDPESYEAKVIYDGEAGDMYSGERSKHQVLPNGNILLTSAHQGRVIEVNQNSEIVFEFVNTYDEKQSLILSEALWLPLDYFSFDASSRSLCKD